MPKKPAKSRQGAKSDLLDQPAESANGEASVSSSQEDIVDQAIDSPSASCDHVLPPHEQDGHAHSSASAHQYEDSAEDSNAPSDVFYTAGDSNAPADVFASADEAAAAAFGSEDLGNAGIEQVDAESEGDVAMRVPVDWGGEFESSLCGLKNVGNTCFLNSVSMLLAHCPGVFWHCMFDLEHKENSDEYFFHSR